MFLDLVLPGIDIGEECRPSRFAINSRSCCHCGLRRRGHQVENNGGVRRNRSSDENLVHLHAAGGHHRRFVGVGHRHVLGLELGDGDNLRIVVRSPSAQDRILADGVVPGFHIGDDAVPFGRPEGDCVIVVITVAVDGDFLPRLPADEHLGHIQGPVRRCVDAHFLIAAHGHPGMKAAAGILAGLPGAREPRLEVHGIRCGKFGGVGEGHREGDDFGIASNRRVVHIDIVFAAHVDRCARFGVEIDVLDHLVVSVSSAFVIVELNGVLRCRVVAGNIPEPYVFQFLVTRYVPVLPLLAVLVISLEFVQVAGIRKPPGVWRAEGKTEG